MLSFDITDRNIRIIKGTESGGKIKISAAAALSLEEAVIVNGRVNDINRVAMMINQVLKTNNMPDREAIVSIASNQTVFKDLLIAPNAKEHEFMKSVRQELQMQINVDDSYAVGYVIVGEPEEDEHGEMMQKILATACPFDVIDCYKRIFHMLGISLKSVMISCNSITKVLLADVKIKAKMPLVAVQIDENFISMNLYENNELSFSRFASIDPEDYDNPDDYIFEAVNQNIFRMLQFARSRGTDAIENVVFYGNVNASDGLYNRLIDEMSNNDIAVSQLKPPPQIHGYQSLEFSEYANAIGAMFKRNKLIEHVNLLESEVGGAAARAMGAAANDRNFPVIAAVSLIASAVLVAGAWITMASIDNSVKSKTRELRAQIESPETAAGLKLYDDLLVQRDVVNAYKQTIETASAAYKSQPMIDKAVYDAVDDALAKTMENVSTTLEANISNVDYDNGKLTFPITLLTEENLSQKYPAQLVQYLYDTYPKLVTAVEYHGYAVTVIELEEGEEKPVVQAPVEETPVEGEAPVEGEDAEAPTEAPTAPPVTKAEEGEKLYAVAFDLELTLAGNEKPTLPTKEVEAEAETAE